MPHTDRAARLASIAAAHARTRRTPAPEPQPTPGLPPRGVLRVSADGTTVQCHVCGRWYRKLTTHIRTHGLDSDTYRAEYELARGQGLLSPAASDALRAAIVTPEMLARSRANMARIHAESLGRDPTPEERIRRLATRIAISEQRTGRYRNGARRDD